MLGEGIWKWGADIVAEIQTWGLPIIPFELVTYLGNETFYFILVPIFFWFVQPAIGVRLLGILLFSSYSNSFFKLVLTEPRPYWVSSEIKGYVFESSYGIPSGHSQNALTIWGYLAFALRSSGKWIFAAAFLLISLICFSRLVLGVHFPQDIIGGLILGAACLFVYLRTADSVLGWFEALPLNRKLIYPVMVSFLLIALALGLNSLIDHEDPANWRTMATMAVGLESADLQELKKAFDPRSMDIFISISATLAGMGVALGLSQSKNYFKIERSLVSYLGIFVVGFLGIGLFRVVPKLLVDGLFDEVPIILEGVVRYIRYFLIILWAVYWAPQLFKALGWAKPLKPEEMSGFLKAKA
ncbi:MAG: phosphatase PAP2 family protein [Leptospiraceae bacterium]